LSEKVVKNGIIRKKQRYICRECGHIFVEGDQRTNEGVIAKKAMCTLLCSLGKASYTMLAKILTPGALWFIAGLSKQVLSCLTQKYRGASRDGV